MSDCLQKLLEESFANVANKQKTQIFLLAWYEQHRIIFYKKVKASLIQISRNSFQSCETKIIWVSIHNILDVNFFFIYFSSIQMLNRFQMFPDNIAYRTLKPKTKTRTK